MIRPPIAIRTALVGAAIALGAWTAPACRAADELVARWNEAVLGAVRFANTPPPAAARHLALVHLAVFDAVNSLGGPYVNFRAQSNAPAGASPPAAAAAAANTVLRLTYPQFTTAWDAILQSQLLTLPDGPAETDGVAWGRAVALRLLGERDFDGANFGVDYRPSGIVGRWEPTPVLFASALLPQWPGVTPFALQRGDQFRPPPPPPLDSPEWAADYNEVKELGARASATRTAVQTEIAWFWADGQGTETPPGRWNDIARQVIGRRDLGLVDAARLLALLNAALTDAGIAAWDAKYAYDLWRPVTAIRRGDLDGNPATAADPGWAPLISTPPFPEYVSGHSTFSAAGAAVLEAFCGTDAFAFSLESDGLFQVSRSWARFSEAAREAGISRIYGGIHYGFANREGYRLGSEIGRWTVQSLLVPREQARISLDRAGDALLVRWPRGALLEACDSLSDPGWHGVAGAGELRLPLDTPTRFFRLAFP